MPRHFFARVGVRSPLQFDVAKKARCVSAMLVPLALSMFSAQIIQLKFHTRLLYSWEIMSSLRV